MMTLLEACLCICDENAAKGIDSQPCQLLSFFFSSSFLCNWCRIYSLFFFFGVDFVLHWRRLHDDYSIRNKAICACVYVIFYFFLCCAGSIYIYIRCICCMCGCSFFTFFISYFAVFSEFFLLFLFAFFLFFF
ncbi:hypothetical protein MOQ_002837, partial [Trypanosoma cruzi marinkellei]